MLKGDGTPLIDPGDRRILIAAKQLGARVVTHDRGHDLAGGFGKLAIQVPGKVHKAENIVKFVVDNLFGK